MSHQCTDATLAPTSAEATYVCTVCDKTHLAGRDIQRCHGCCRLFPVGKLKRRKRNHGGGAFCSLACEKAFAHERAQNLAEESVECPPVLSTRKCAPRTARCPTCHEDFVTDDPWQKFCKSRCASLASARAFRARKRQQAKEQAS